MAEVVTGWNVDTFSFDIEFQKQIITVMIQEPTVFERIGLNVDPKFFEIREYSVIYKNIINFFNEYKGMPTKEVLYDLVTSGSYKSDTLKETMNEIFTEKRMLTSTVKYIEENVKNFVSCQALKEAISDSIDDLGDINKHENVKNRVEKALMIGASLEDYGTDVYDYDEVDSRWTRREQDCEIKRLSSGWVEFDRIFGGFGNGELFTFMGPAHSGKSMYLINVGANLALQKYNVVHISLEMSEEISSQRYDMRLLGCTKDEFKTDNTIENLKSLLDKRIGRIIVKRYPSSSCTATDISTYLRRVENAKGFKADALIVDYADIMRSGAKYNDRRFELDTIYQELRNIGIEFNIPVITATQLNRDGLKELTAGGILTEEHIAESYGIARHVDCAVTINATPQDNANNQSTVYVCKNRDGESGGSFRMFVDFRKALVSEWAAPSISDSIRQSRQSNKNRR